MKKSRFSDSQILVIRKQVETGTPVPDLCQGHGISTATYYKWRSKFGGMDASLMARLRSCRRKTAGSRKCTPRSGLSRRSCRRP